MEKTITVAVVCSAGALVIGIYIGRKQKEEELRPKVKDLEKRVKYLEQGKVKQ